jgi:hypothetical protein
MTRGSDTHTCHCSAYAFPHRFKGGKCDGWDAVERVFENGSACRDCKLYEEQREPHGELTGICMLLETQDQARPEDCPGIELVVKENLHGTSAKR